MKTKNILIIGFIVLGVALCLAWMISSISSSIKVKMKECFSMMIL